MGVVVGKLVGEQIVDEVVDLNKFLKVAEIFRVSPVVKLVSMVVELKSRVVSVIKVKGAVERVVNGR